MTFHGTDITIQDEIETVLGLEVSKALSEGSLYASAGYLRYSTRDLWLSGSLEALFTHLQDIFSPNRTTSHSIASLRGKPLFGRGSEAGRGVKVSRGRIYSS